MLHTITADSLFYEYYEQWIKVYKEGAIRNVTMNKYLMTLAWLKKLIPDLKLGDMTRITYQQLINDYAELHERQTTMDFHHQIKCAILDAVDEGLIARDPTRKAIIKGKAPREKKPKYLNQFELHTINIVKWNRRLNDLQPTIRKINLSYNASYCCIGVNIVITNLNRDTNTKIVQSIRYCFCIFFTNIPSGFSYTFLHSYSFIVSFKCRERSKLHSSVWNSAI